MADLTFNTAAGKTVDREMLLACLNTGTTSSPVWSVIGKRVPDSSEEVDWSEDSSTDILGQTYTTLSKPTITQSFDPVPLDGGDTASLKIWNMAIKDQDYAALAAQDMLIVHLYAGTSQSQAFAERYAACAIRPTGLGGEGGGNISMPLDVTYGGVRTVGTAAISGSTISFTPGT